MVHHQIGDQTHAAFVRFTDQEFKILQRAEIRVNIVEVGNIVPVVF